MYIGKDKNRFLVSSDIEVLKEEFFLSDIVSTKDNEIVRVDKDKISS
jgi:hypothetical protein